MSFLNSEVDVSLLPASENVELQAINRTYLILLRIEWLITSFFFNGWTCTTLVFHSRTTRFLEVVTTYSRNNIAASSVLCYAAKII
ncbi:MAG: hypothetical protein WKF70_00530 [Chitinophagaceae bacterium]